MYLWQMIAHSLGQCFLVYFERPTVTLNGFGVGRNDTHRRYICNLKTYRDANLRWNADLFTLLLGEVLLCSQ